MAEAGSTLAAEAEPTQPGEAAEDIESRVKTAMAARVPYFLEQADSLTLEGVRRVLEKDLGLEIYALDVHRKFLKNCLTETLESANNEVVNSNEPASNGEKWEPVETVKGEKDTKSRDGDIMEDSPVMGLMTGHEKSRKETVAMKPEDTRDSTAPSEDGIKQAIEKRASHLRDNTESITLAGVRRLLEQDLKLDLYALDPFKKFISEQIDVVLAPPKVSKSGTDTKKTNIKKGMTSKHRKAGSLSSESASEEDEEVEVKPRKRTAVRSKPQIHEGLKKRKRLDEDIKEAGKKQRKESKKKSEENSEAEDAGDVSEDGTSGLSAERPVKKKEVQKPSHGRRVEHLKSVIRACGMSIPPSVYKRAKQAPDNKYESVLIKELEDILAKEGLGPDPSEKEIKDVKKRRDKARELEGIDMSNIVSSSRRRSTARYAPPPEPELPVDSDSGSEESDEEDDNDDDEDDKEVEEQEDDEDDAGDSD